MPVNRSRLIQDFVEYDAENIDMEVLIQEYFEMRTSSLEQLSDEELILKCENELPDFYIEDYTNE